MQTKYPANHCFNPAFRYVPAAMTDIRKTFQRVKQDQQRTIDMPTKVFMLASCACKS